MYPKIRDKSCTFRLSTLEQKALTYAAECNGGQTLAAFIRESAVNNASEVVNTMYEEANGGWTA